MLDKNTISKINLLGGVKNLNLNTCSILLKQCINKLKIDNIDYMPVLTDYDCPGGCYVSEYKINSEHYNINICADIEHHGLSTYSIFIKDKMFNSIIHKLNSFINKEYFRVNANNFKETYDYLSDVADIHIELYSTSLLMIVDNSWHYEIPHEFSLKLIHDIDYLNKFITDIFETFINGCLDSIIKKAA